MNITTSITGDCRFISLGVSGATSGGSIDILIKNGTAEYPIAATANNNGVYTSAIFLQTVLSTQAGIFEITVTDNTSGDIAYSAEFGKCELDCCIAKKVDSLLGCDCECTKCSDTLIVAERVHLLITAIETNLAQIGGDSAANAAIYTNANAKYKKALELCSDSCGCNC